MSEDRIVSQSQILHCFIFFSGLIEILIINRFTFPVVISTWCSTWYLLLLFSKIWSYCRSSPNSRQWDNSSIFKHCVKLGMLHFLEVLLKLQKFRWCQQQCSWKATVCIPKTPSTLTQKINNVLQNLDFWQENSIQAARASTFLYSCCCCSSSAI